MTIVETSLFKGNSVLREQLVDPILKFRYRPTLGAR